MQDLKYALRTLSRSPAFTLLVVAILALSIGTSTAVFSVVDSVLLRPLPYPGAGRLVAIWETNPRMGVERDGPSGPNFLDWREQSRSFEDMALLEVGTGTLTGMGEPEQFPGLRVSTNFLTMLGAQPVLGRVFRPEDGAGAARHNVAVLSYGFWQRRFGGDPQVIGRKVTVNHQVYECVGVLRKDVWSPVRADAFVPWPVEELRGRSRWNRDFGVIARLNPGVTVARAQQEMDGITARTAQRFPQSEGWKTTIVPLQQALVEYIRPALLMLQASVLFLMLLACANVANLLLARMTGRQREVGIRAALGAGRWRLIRQFLVENLVLSVAGGLAGLLVAAWGVDLLLRVIPPAVPLPNGSAEVILPPIALNAGALVFAIAVSMACSLVFGLFPALQASRADLADPLKEGGRSATGTLGHQRTRRLLVISETALAFMLLMGAALTARSFLEMQKVNPGFQAENVMTFRLRLPTDTLYQRPEQRIAFFRQTLGRIAQIPGVTASGLTQVLPLGQENSRAGFNIPERGKAQGEMMADLRVASPGLFQALGIALSSGRPIDNRDTTDRPRVLVVDETFARRFFPNENPIGKRVDMQGAREIVGVVAAVRHYGLDKPPRPTVYLPYEQAPWDRVALVVKTAADPRSVITAVKQAVWAVDPDQPVFMIRRMDEYISLATSAPRIALLLLGVFAAAALGLAAFGIYGVISYTVSQRTHEFGLRMALGAQSSQVRALVMSHGLRWSAIGMAAGLAGTLLLAPVLRSVLYGVSALDPLVIAITAAVLLAIAAAANYVPALRATRVDPMEALRYQ